MAEEKRIDAEKSPFDHWCKPNLQRHYWPESSNVLQNYSVCSPFNSGFYWFYGEETIDLRVFWGLEVCW